MRTAVDSVDMRCRAWRQCECRHDNHTSSRPVSPVSPLFQSPLPVTSAVKILRVVTRSYEF